MSSGFNINVKPLNDSAAVMLNSATGSALLKSAAVSDAQQLSSGDQNGAQYLFEWEYQPAVTVDMQLQTAITRTQADTAYSSYDYDESIGCIPPRSNTIQYLFPHAPSQNYNNGTTSLRFIMNQQYVLTNVTRQYWLLIWVADVGGTQGSAMTVAGIVVLIVCLLIDKYGECRSRCCSSQAQSTQVAVAPVRITVQPSERGSTFDRSAQLNRYDIESADTRAGREERGLGRER